MTLKNVNFAKSFVKKLLYDFQILDPVVEKPAVIS